MCIVLQYNMYKVCCYVCTYRSCNIFLAPGNKLLQLDLSEYALRLKAASEDLFCLMCRLWCCDTLNVINCVDWCQIVFISAGDGEWWCDWSVPGTDRWQHGLSSFPTSALINLPWLDGFVKGKPRLYVSI